MQHLILQSGGASERVPNPSRHDPTVRHLVGVISHYGGSIVGTPSHGLNEIITSSLRQLSRIKYRLALLTNSFGCEKIRIGNGVSQ